MFIKIKLKNELFKKIKFNIVLRRMGKDLKKFKSKTSCKKWKTKKHREFRKQCQNSVYQVNKLIKTKGYTDDQYYNDWSEYDLPKKSKTVSYQKPNDNMKYLTKKYENVVKKFIEQTYDEKCEFGKFSDGHKIDIYPVTELPFHMK
jgi:hypothetical protein